MYYSLVPNYISSYNTHLKRVLLLLIPWQYYTTKDQSACNLFDNTQL